MKKLFALFGLIMMLNITIIVFADTSKETIADSNGRIIKEIVFNEGDSGKELIKTILFTYTPSGELLETRTLDKDGNIIKQNAASQDIYAPLSRFASAGHGTQLNGPGS